MVPDAREVLDALQVSDARRYPAGEVSRRYQTRAEAGSRAVRGRRERGGGEIDGIGRADLYQTRGAIRRADTKQETRGKNRTRRTGGVGRAAGIRRAEVSDALRSG